MSKKKLNKAAPLDEAEVSFTLKDTPGTPPAETNIVKVQVPLAEYSAGDVSQALIYNWDRSLDFKVVVDDELLEIMDGQAKKYFYYEPDPEDDGYLLGEEAPWQEW